MSKHKAKKRICQTYLQIGLTYMYNLSIYRLYNTHEEGFSMLTHTILATVEKGRLAKAAQGYASSAYAITVTGQSEAEVSGFVANGDGKEYGVVLTAARTFCSCPDSMFRHTVCKHAVVLALH